MKTLYREDLDKSISTTYTGDAVHLESMQGYSICAVWSGSSPTGTFKLQASNNAFLDNVNNNANPDATWVDITGSSNAVTTGGTYFWNVSDVYYKSVRIVYTRSSGTGTASFYIYGKGII